MSTAMELRELAKTHQNPAEWNERRKILASIQGWQHVVAHEAGHAVALAALEWPIFLVSVDPLFLDSVGSKTDGKSIGRLGFCRGEELRPSENERETFLYKLIVAGLAAGIADELLYGSSPGTSDDMEDVRRYAEEMVRLKIADDNPDYERHVKDTLDEGHEQAKALFDNPDINRAFSNAADALNEYGSFSTFCKGKLHIDNLMAIIGSDIAAYRASLISSGDDVGKQT